MIVRRSSGAVPFARLPDGRVVMAEWRTRALPHESVVEWSLTLEGRALSIRDKASGAPTVIALHHWDEGDQKPREAVLRGGVYEIVVPMAWHSMCAAFSGTFTIELDAERLEARYSEDIQVEL